MLHLAIVTFEDPGGPEVDNLEVGVWLVGVEQDILGFEVPVDDLSVVTVGNGRQYLFHGLSGLPLGKVVRLHDFVEQFAACTELGDDKYILIVLKIFVYFDYVWVVLINC